MAGSPRGSPRRRWPLLCVEPLEDRSLLSSSTVGAAVVQPPAGDVALQGVSRTGAAAGDPALAFPDGPATGSAFRGDVLFASSGGPDLVSGPAMFVDGNSVAGPDGALSAGAHGPGQFAFDSAGFGLWRGSMAFDGSHDRLPLAGPLDPALAMVMAARPGDPLSSGALPPPGAGNGGVPSSVTGDDFLLAARRGFEGQRILFDTAGPLDPLANPSVTLNDLSAARLRADPEAAGRWAFLWAGDREALLAGWRRYDRAAGSGPGSELPNPSGGRADGLTPVGQPLSGSGSGLRGVLPSERTAGEGFASPLTSAALPALAAAGRAGVVAAREAVHTALSLPIFLPQAAGPVVTALLGPSPVGGAATDGDAAGSPAPVPRGGTPAWVAGRSERLLRTGGGSAEPGAADHDGPTAPGLPVVKGLAALDLPAQAAALLEGGLPFDPAALAREVDAFFAHLGVLGEAKGTVQAGTRFLPWVVLLTGAAFEIARRWEQHRSRRPDLNELLPGAVGFHPEEDR